MVLILAQSVNTLSGILTVVEIQRFHHHKVFIPITKEQREDAGELEKHHPDGVVEMNLQQVRAINLHQMILSAEPAAKDYEMKLVT